MNCSCDHNINNCLDNVPIFSSLSNEEKNHLRSLAIAKKYEKGQLVYRASELHGRLYVINEGSIKISRITSEGKEQVIRIVNKGEFMGELSLFTHQLSSDYAETLEDTVICIIDGNVLKSYIKDHFEIGFKIIEELSKRLSLVEELVEGINLHSVEWRISKYLLNKCDENNVVFLNTSKAIFSSQLGMTQETLSRKLALFQEKKWIRLVSSKKIAILNRKALEDIL